MSIRRIGILTGGGDVPGLNTVIRNVTQRSNEEGIEVLGIKRGWGGLIYMDPDGKIDDSPHLIELNQQTVRTIDRTGGTILRTSRTKPSNVLNNSDLELYRGISTPEKTDMTKDVLKNIERLGLDALITIGGDDTLSYSVALSELGIKVIGIPKTMDNDVNGTEYCIGFSSAISKSMHLINDLRTPMGSHERYGIIELFGRNAGFTTLYASYVSSANRALIPEVDFNPDHVIELLQQDREKNPSKYAIVLISEGAKPIGGQILEGGREDAYGHKKLGGIGFQLADFISQKTGYKTVVQRLGYLMRSGAPDAIDQLVAGLFGNIAVDSLLQDEYGVMTAIVDGKYSTVPISLVTKEKRVVDVEKYYDSEKYRPNYKNMKGLPLFLR